MQRSNFAAWVLITFGVLLLLHQFDVLYFSRVNVIVLVSFFVGALLVKKGLNHPERKGILGGSFFILFGISVVLMRINFFPIDDNIGIGIVFLNLGLANLIYFLSYRRNVTNLVSGIIFMIIGIPFLIVYYEVLPVWRVSDYFYTYWPVLLILIGGGMLAEGLLKRTKKSTG